jgi:hypothetical protein
VCPCWSVTLSLFTSPASAQASRTWVSGVGDDANPCSRTAPCKTFAGAISKTALNGEIDCLDPGGFGTVTITKSITLDCSGTFGSDLNAGTNGINIPFDSFGGTDVRKTVNIRGISFQGFDSGIVGINISGNGASSFVNVEDCVINGNFGGSARGILDARVNGTLVVLNTTIRNMGTNGISFTNTASGLVEAVLSNVRITNAGTGVSVGPLAAVQINRSIFMKNATAAVTTTGGSVEVTDSTLAYNGIAANQAGGSITASTNNFWINNAGVSGTLSSFTNNRFNFNGGGGTISPIGSTSNPTGLQ